MSPRNLMSRLDKLDRPNSARPGADRRVVRIMCEADESADDAIARWSKAHPDEPPLIDDDNTLIIMRRIVTPKLPQEHSR